MFNQIDLIKKQGAKLIHADMIVMGSYGHNLLQGALLGGTARKVVKNSEIPVLVVRLPKK